MTAHLISFADVRPKTVTSARQPPPAPPAGAAHAPPPPSRKSVVLKNSSTSVHPSFGHALDDDLVAPPPVRDASHQ